jgi:4-amino-4-deoxy-L-arabinose transferase-like glycosyltransferase
MTKQISDIPFGSKTTKPSFAFETRDVIGSVRERWIVLAIAGLSFMWATFAAPLIFPYYSNNHDEPVYALQAETLLRGNLTLPSNEFIRFFTPWLTKADSSHAIFKYTPVQASVLALGEMLMGSMHAAIGLVAGLTVILCYWFLSELGLPRPIPWLSSLLVLLSPFFLIQSATLLPYSTALLLHLVAGCLLVRAIRLNRLLMFLLAGVALGIDFFARPFDAILFALPIGLFWVISQRSRLPLLVNQLACFVIGFAPILCLVLAYNYRLTGNPFVFPFSLLDPLDTLGFGPRRMFPGNAPIIYDLSAALEALSSNLLQLNLWLFGGALLIGCALLRLFVLPVQRSHWLLLGISAVYPLGYIFFWGTYMSTTLWKGVWYLGPFYYFPLLVPVSVLGIEGWLAIRKHNALIAKLLGIAMTVANLALVVWHLGQNLEYSAKSSAIYSPIESAHLKDAIVFVPPVYGPILLHPFAALGNTPDVDGPILYAINRYSDNFALIQAYPDRMIYRFDYFGLYTEEPDNVAQTQLQPIERLRTGQFQQHMRIVNPDGSPIVSAFLWNGNRKVEYLIDDNSRLGKTYDVDWTITTHEAFLTGDYVRQTPDASPLESDQYLSLAVSFGQGQDEASASIYEWRFWFQVLPDGRLDLALPPEQWHNPEFPRGTFVQEPIGTVISDR